MKNVIIIFFLALTFSLAQAQQKAKFRLTGTSKQLVVNGVPTIVLGGELANSSATSVADIEKNFPKLEQMGLNTVAVPISWNLFEPTEDHYDYTLIDKIISQAERNHLNVIILWFGAWKSSTSCYAPVWFKRDGLRFPRMYTREGKTLECASLFSENVLAADNSALGRLLERINKMDVNNRVVMVQLENEVGMLGSARDYSPSTNDLYAGTVPEKLIKYLIQNKELLHPSMLAKWGNNGYKTEGSWTAVFGDDIYTEEIFMAYHYADYIETLAKAARFQYNIPLSVSAAVNNSDAKPSEYPSGGPVAHLIDIWHCAAPSIDIITPNIYGDNFLNTIEQYSLFNNPLFISKTPKSKDNGIQAFYAIGEYEAIGICPSSIDKISEQQSTRLSLAYNKLQELIPLLTQWYGKSALKGLYFDADKHERIIECDDMRIIARHYNTLQPNVDNAQSLIGGGFLLRLNSDEYIIAGSGIVVAFESSEEPTSMQPLNDDGFAQQSVQNTEENNKWFGARRIGILSVEEVSINSDGNFNTIRNINGDETGQGRYVQIDTDNFKILHVKLYEYK